MLGSVRGARSNPRSYRDRRARKETSRSSNRTGRSPASGLYGAFLVKCVTPFLSSFVIPFFCSTRAAEHSSAPTAYFHRRRAQRRSRTALLQRRRRLVLDARERGGSRRRSGGWPRKDPRGACHWPADQTRTTLVFG